MIQINYRVTLSDLVVRKLKATIFVPPTITDEKTTVPDALVLIATHCAQCPSVLDGLNRLIKEGALGSLEVVNIENRPEVAKRLGARSVPWVKIGPFELVGAYQYRELAQWTAYAVDGTGMAPYLNLLIESQQLDKVVALIRKDPEILSVLVGMLRQSDTSMGVRIGIGAAFEELADSGHLDRILVELGELTHATDVHIRADACHYLGLTGNADAVPFVRALLDDEHHDVREIAAETLETLNAVGTLSP